MKIYQLPTNPRFINLTGKRFGRLVVKSYAGTTGTQRWHQWLCVCDCGNEAVVRGACLPNGHTKSCGCLQRESTSKSNVKHQGSSNYKRTPEYEAWLSMRSRCVHPYSNRFHTHGARGITVCKRWLNSFKNFLADMGYRPSPEHSLDRIDNNGNYTPSNCRWATQKEQANNRQNSIHIELGGVTRSLSDWARITGLKRHTIYRRIRDGWSPKKALTTPARNSAR